MTVILTAPTLRFVKLHSFKKIFCVTIPMLKKIWLFSFFFFFLTPKEGKKKKNFKKSPFTCFRFKKSKPFPSSFFFKKKKNEEGVPAFRHGTTQYFDFFFFFPPLGREKKKRKKRKCNLRGS